MILNILFGFCLEHSRIFNKTEYSSYQFREQIVKQDFLFKHPEGKLSHTFHIHSHTCNALYGSNTPLHFLTSLRQYFNVGHVQGRKSRGSSSCPTSGISLTLRDSTWGYSYQPFVVSMTTRLSGVNFLTKQNIRTS